MKRKIFFLLCLQCMVSGCQKSVLNQNMPTYEKRCLAEGLEKGSVFFSQCMQRHFYVDEDKIDEEKYAIGN